MQHCCNCNRTWAVTWYLVLFIWYSCFCFVLFLTYTELNLIFLIVSFISCSLPALPSLSSFTPLDSTKYRTPRTQWRRTASALWPTDWFKSRSILCTRTSPWRSASHHLGPLRARRNEREKVDDVGEDATGLARGRCERRELKGRKENWECLTGIWKNMKLKIREQNLSQAHHSVSFCLVSTLFSLIFLSFRTQALSTNNFLKQTVGAITPVTINDCRMNNLWTKGGLSVASNLSFPIKLEGNRWHVDSEHWQELLVCHVTLS